MNSFFSKVAVRPVTLPKRTSSKVFSPKLWKIFLESIFAKHLLVLSMSIECKSYAQ